MTLASLIVSSMVIYVSPSGDDQGAGTMSAPVKSIHVAQERLRAVGGGRIVLRDGVHYLAQALRLTREDSRLVIEGAKGEEPVISGGEPLKLSWQKVGDHWEAAANLVDLDQLWIDGRRQRMARYPNAQPGKAVFDAWDLVHTSEPDANRQALSPERVAKWANPTGGYVHAMHPALWGDMHWRIDGKKSDGSLDMVGGWQNNRPGPMHPRYRMVENIREELDVPGEFFYDAERRTLMCIPEDGVDLNRAEVSAVRLKHLIEVEGNQNQPVESVVIRGIRFRQAARTFMENKEPLLRSDWTVYRGGAILVEGSENLRIEDCWFDQVGGNTIFVNRWNRGLQIRRCVIQDSGANGIAFVGDPEAVRSPLFSYGQAFSYDELDRTPGPRSENFPKDCLVEDCIITRTGRDEKQTAPIQISMSMNITVRHCSIYDVPRAGINISEGTWGGHVIEGCDVFNTVLETGDHGSFNSWGRDRFWHPNMDVVNREVAKDPALPRLDMVRTNVIRGNRWRCDHGWDIDLDDGSSHYLIENNVLLNGGLKMREGFGRIARNNVILNNSLHPHCWYESSGDVFERNIVFDAYQPAGGMPAGKWGKNVDRNQFSAPTSIRDRFRAQSCDEHSMVGDPEFVDPSTGDFRVKDTSPAKKLGFRNFPMDRFGVRPAHLRKIAKRPEIPPVQQNVRGQLPPVAVRWHGATVRDLSAMEFSAFGVAQDRGGVVIDSTPQGDVLKDFRRGDLIVQLGGQRVRNLAELTQAILKLPASPNVDILIVREQRETRIQVRHRLEVPRI